MTLAIEHIRVKADRMVARVRVNGPARNTTPALAERALAAMPALAMHSCVNDTGPTFGHVIGHTSLPHLLEHVTIELLARDYSDASAVFAGVTEWLDEEAGVARVQVRMRDDLQTFAAFREALDLVNLWLAG